MARPTLPEDHRKRFVGVRLSAVDVARAQQAANPGHSFSDVPARDLSTSIAICVAEGAKALERSTRIAGEGFELSPCLGGIELLFKARTAYGAHVLNDLIRIYEEQMQDNVIQFRKKFDGVAGFLDAPKHDLPAALAELRDQIARYGGDEVVMHDSAGRAVHIQFLNDPDTATKEKNG